MRDIGWFADSDNDGLDTEHDACDASDLRSTIYVGDENTGIANVMFGNGCTTGDYIAAAAAAAKNHGDFVSGVSALANAWKGVVITNQQHAVLVKAAAHSTIGN